MTNENREQILYAIGKAIEEFQIVYHAARDGDEIKLYDLLKVAHDAALEPWCLLTRIMSDRAEALRSALRAQRATVPQSRFTVNDL